MITYWELHSFFFPGQWYGTILAFHVVQVTSINTWEHSPLTGYGSFKLGNRFSLMLSRSLFPQWFRPQTWFTAKTQNQVSHLWNNISTLQFFDHNFSLFVPPEYRMDQIPWTRYYLFTMLLSVTCYSLSGTVNFWEAKAHSVSKRCGHFIVTMLS